MVMTARERRARRVAPLFAYLRERGIPRTWLAAKLGVPKFSIYSIEDGRMHPPKGFFEDAEAALMVAPGTFGGAIPAKWQRKSA